MSIINVIELFSHPATLVQTRGLKGSSLENHDQKLNEKWVKILNAKKISVNTVKEYKIPKAHLGRISTDLISLIYHC